MPEPAICLITGPVFTGRNDKTVEDEAQEYAFKSLEITPLQLPSVILSTTRFTVRADEVGEFAFGLYQGGVYNIRGDVRGFNSDDGTIVTIPEASEITLDALVALTTFPTTGAVVRYLNQALSTLIGTFNFLGFGVSVRMAEAGVAEITISNEVAQNIQSGNYTLEISDVGKQILHPQADDNPRTFLIPSNTDVAYDIGAVITFVNEINDITIDIDGTDELILAGHGLSGAPFFGPLLLAANGMASILKITSTRWMANGAGLTQV